MKLAALSLAGFAVLSFLVHQQAFNTLDLRATIVLQGFIPRFFDPWLSIFSVLGSAEVTLAVWLVLAGWLTMQRHYKTAVLVSVIFWLGLGIEIIGKHQLYHPGPPREFFRSILPFLPSKYIRTNYSYPSGHVYRTAFLVILALVLWTGKNLKYFLTGVLILMVVSRVYLGEHWLSDTLGGLLLGSGCALLAADVVHRWTKQKDYRTIFQ